jgi:hypothetical protein
MIFSVGEALAGAGGITGYYFFFLRFCLSLSVLYSRGHESVYQLLIHSLGRLYLPGFSYCAMLYCIVGHRELGYSAALYQYQEMINDITQQTTGYLDVSISCCVTRLTQDILVTSLSSG